MLDRQRHDLESYDYVGKVIADYRPIYEWNEKISAISDYWNMNSASMSDSWVKQ